MDQLDKSHLPRRLMMKLQLAAAPVPVPKAAVEDAGDRITRAFINNALRKFQSQGGTIQKIPGQESKPTSAPVNPTHHSNLTGDDL